MYASDRVPSVGTAPDTALAPSGLKETPDALVQQWLVHVGLPLVLPLEHDLLAGLDAIQPALAVCGSERCVLQADSASVKLLR
jgi:hypothetical protein